MARSRTVYCCTECGGQQPRWVGRCPSCGGWSTLVEETIGAHADSRKLGVNSDTAPIKPVLLGEIDTAMAPRFATNIAEFDRVLGGGLVPGSVVLLAGEPGVGKSTLALQIAAGLGSRAAVLYVTGEESPEQLCLRAERIAAVPKDLLVFAETRVESIAEIWSDRTPSVVTVDSIQTLRTDRIESAPGSVAQVRECAAELSALAKSRNTALILVGHVTKEGAIAGPRVLEHLVDVVLAFEGDRGQIFRLLRASKNRFGSTQEVGVFSMTERGLEDVENPSELFLAERRADAPGSCIAPLVEGSRPMLVELQALVAPAGYGTARRTTVGLDDGRLALLLAALDRHTDVDFLSRDVYANVTGGLRVSEPGADLALALALVSSRLDASLPADVAAFGEIGLGGEVRRVGRIDLRLREAARLGFRRVVLPAGVEVARPEGAELIPVANVAAAVAWLRASSAVHSPENHC
ncbi:MAG: DNA repair protein RadA [Deltaproteobacteria bacterium]|jgi:DNA repair protein RadA/Sms|nr:DNA repair protein RadA [Deltaproteobacteria bacterium]